MNSMRKRHVGICCALYLCLLPPGVAIAPCALLFPFAPCWRHFGHAHGCMSAGAAQFYVGPPKPACIACDA